ncbi:hypothetical protein [Oleomonas cavernae]|nr:hypothetical protein [Oleomonas cavernae]
MTRFMALGLGALVSFAVAAAGSAAGAQEAGKPILSGMVAENDPPVQLVRDALTSFQRTHGRWPSSLDELAAYAGERGHPIDFAAFSATRYAVQQANGALVALFEFTAAGSNASGAFAVAVYDIR